MPNFDPVVIVIGAGASKEVRLPIGLELTKSVADSLDFKVDHFGRLTGGDDKVRECVYKLAQGLNNRSGTLDDYYIAANMIRQAMPLAPSIDNFIDSHRTDLKIAQVGKLAIACSILKAEKASSLYFDRSNSNNRLDFSPLQSTWFAAIFRLLTQHCSSDELSARFSRLTIISFNYDRCFKHFIKQALLAYYSLSESDASDLTAKICIHHPYGLVGDMRYETGGPGTDFGEQAMTDDLIRSAERIRTFTESNEAGASITNTIRSSVQNAKALVFLGFAYHPMNLEILYGKTRPDSASSDCDVIGTAMGISDSNVMMIKSDLATLGGYTGTRIRLHQDLTAGAIVEYYSRLLAKKLHNAA